MNKKYVKQNTFTVPTVRVCGFRCDQHPLIPFCRIGGLCARFLRSAQSLSCLPLPGEVARCKP